MPSLLEQRMSGLGLTVNEQLRDRALRHSVFLARLEVHEANKVVAFMDEKVLPDLFGRLTTRLDRIVARGFDTGPVTTKRLQKLTTELGLSLTEGMGDARKAFAQGLLDIGTYEAQTELAAIDKALSPLKDIAPTAIETSLPSVGLIREAIYRRPFQGRLLKDWFNGLAKGLQTAVSDQVKIGLIEGDSLGAIMNRVRGTGAIPGVGRAAKRQALAICRTAVTHVTTQAREAVYLENQKLLQGVRWVSTLDAKTSDLCFVGSTRVTSLGAPLRVTRRLYQGDLVVIRTTAGEELRTTPHHPILTTHGWRPAQDLEPGQEVLYSISGDGLCAACRQHVGVPPTLAEIADASFQPSRADVLVERATPADFHGDGAGTNGQISVATLHGDLVCDLMAGRAQHRGDVVLSRVYPRSSSFDGLGALDDERFARMAADQMSSEINARLLQHLVDEGFTPAGSPCDGEGLHAIGEHLDHGSSFGLLDTALLASGVVAHDAEALQVAGDGGGGDSVMPCEFCGTFAVSVTPQDVLSVRVEHDFSGHVFNLESKAGAYLANGCVVKNCWTLDGHVYNVGEGIRPPAHMSCRSTTVAEVKSLFDLGLTKTQYKAVPRGYRASFGSSGPAPVPRGITGEQFLRRQSHAFQAEVLGKGRADLFRRGVVPFDKFVDVRGRPTSLGVLKTLEKRIEGAA